MVYGKMNKILFEDNHILVVEKPVNMLVQADNTKDNDLLTELKKYIKDKYNKPGNVYLGLVHRLDRPVGGVMVFARTSKAASRLSNQVRENTVTKKYLAVVDGIVKEKAGILEDYLLKIESDNKTIVDKNGKYAKLEYEVIGVKDGKSLVKIKLHTGRSHQIRVQFSSRNYPLWGDQKYNKNALVGEQIALWSYHLEFVHPTTKELLKFTDLPPLDEYPWVLFEEMIKDM